MRRLLLVLGGAATILAGCLFPSFDDLKGSGSAGDDDDDAGEAKDSGKGSSTSSTSGTASSASSSGSTSSSSSSSSSSSGDAATTPTKSIRCDTKTCTGDTICCAPIVGDYQCKAASNPGCDANDILVCDGAEDCAPGQFCCQGGPAGGASVCQNGPCSGFTYCSPDAQKCPADKPSCSGGAPGGPDNFKSCQ